MIDEGADKNSSCHVLSCVPGSMLAAGDTKVNKTAKNTSPQVMLRQVNRLSAKIGKCTVLQEHMGLSLALTQAWGSVRTSSWGN